MRRDVRAFLYDAKSHADLILEFVQGRSLEEYRANAMVRAAVGRQFEIIGEALNQLSLSDPDLADRIPQLRQTVGFRNVLIHGYSVIDHGTVWRTIEEDLPPLRRCLIGLLVEFDA